MAKEIYKGATDKALEFFLVLASDHITAATGKTPSVLIRKEGGSFTSPAGTVSEIGNGWYQVNPNAANYDTLGSLLLSATAAGCDPSDRDFLIIPDPRGPGSILATHNIAKANSTPVAGAQVWITTGTNPSTGIVWGPLASDALGNVPILLDPGTYYRWVQLAGYNWTNPQQFTVAATPSTQTFNWLDAVAATPAAPIQTAVTGPLKASIQVVYDPAAITFDPYAPDQFRWVKLGFVAKPDVVRLRILADTAKQYVDYKLWGPMIGQGVWRTLPNSESDGSFVVEVALNKQTTIPGDKQQPFALTNGMRLIIATATDTVTYVEQTVTFNTASFASISAATAAEVAAVINLQATNVTASVQEGRVVITSKKLDSFLQLTSPDDADYLLGFDINNRSTIYYPMWRANSSKRSRIYLGLRKEGAAGANEVAHDWIVRDEVVPVMPSDVRKMEWFGVPLFTEDGQTYSDEQTWRDILDAMADLEQATRVRLTPMRVVTEVALRTPALMEHFDYDLAESAYDYDVRTARSFWHLQTREYPLISLEEYHFRDWNNEVAAEFNKDAKVYLESGQIKLVPGVVGTATWRLYQTQSFLAQVHMSQWPKWIWLRYTAGPRGGKLAHDAIDAIRKSSWIRVARVISDSIARGSVSSSISDGAVSESRSTAASGQGSLFGGRIVQYEQQLARWTAEFADRQKGVTTIMI